MKAEIYMVFDGHDFLYGVYPFNTDAEKNKVNELAEQIFNERDCQVYVKKVE